MVFEGQYFANGQLRWNWGWATPNYAGAFIVSALAFCFVFSGSRWRWFGLVAEVAGFWMLAKTYSRGAAVAWLAAWVWAVIVGAVWRDRVARGVWAMRLGAFAVVLAVTGFVWSRATAKGPVDHSVSNRQTLWAAGLAMVAAAPANGCGAGESGRVFMDWFQAIPSSTKYSTMVNSYLHVATERGLPILGTVLFGIIWVLLVAGRQTRNKEGPGAVLSGRTIGLAASASLVAFLACNLFSTLWIEPKLWIAPSIAAGLIIVSAVRSAQWRSYSNAAIALGGALLLTGGLFLAGSLVSRNLPYKIVFLDRGTTALERTGVALSADEPVWHFWTDTQVLGPTPGKEIRLWFATPNAPRRAVIHRSVEEARSVNLHRGDIVVVCGKYAECLRAETLLIADTTILLNPYGRLPSLPPTARTSSITLTLPEANERGGNDRWNAWAQTIGAKVILLPDSGVDLRSKWPAVLAPFSLGR